MCFISTPKIPDAPTPPAPLAPIETPKFGNDELKKKDVVTKGLKIGTKKLQVPLGGTGSSSNTTSSGLGIPKI